MNQHNDDDRQIGRILNRREVLALFGAGALILPACRSGDSSDTAAQGDASTTTAGGATPTTTAATPTTAAAAGTASSPPTCVVKPELTEGPFFVDVQLNRSDIRTDPSSGAARPGASLKLDFRVSRVGTGGACTALADAVVDVWHCDAEGTYSAVSGNSQRFLRGFQTTDATGKASFTTIYPGGYQGRSVHIHFKVRSGNREFTSQLFFDDAFSDQVYAAGAPYTSGRRTLNSADGIFRQTNNLLTLDVKRDGQGYAATFDIGMQV